jgi:hypothetical protein
MKKSFYLDLKSRTGFRYSAVSLLMKIENKNHLIAKYGNQGLKQINIIYEKFHSICNSFQGEVAHIVDLILWKHNRDQVMKEFLKYITDIGKI